jgi:hypothetical protein
VISVQAAVKAAIAALPDYLGGRAPEGIRVEEVVPPEADNAWRVTLSYLEPGSFHPDSFLDSLVSQHLRAPPAPERVLRVFAIDAMTGTPKSMTLRNAG